MEEWQEPEEFPEEKDFIDESANPENRPKISSAEAYSKWNQYEHIQKGKRHISLEIKKNRIKMTSPDKKTIIEVKPVEGTDIVCIEESPRECRQIRDPKGTILRIVAERLWHEGWTVE